MTPTDSQPDTDFSVYERRYCFSNIVFLFFHFQFVISGLYNCVRIRARDCVLLCLYTYMYVSTDACNEGYVFFTDVNFF
jgi:hypothetical protein